jgi:DME family drug/metabolite transporter
MHSNTTLPAGRGILYILVAAVAWGTGGAVAAILYDTSGLGPIAVSCWRFAIAVPLLGAIHLTNRRGRPAARPGWRHLVATGTGLAVYQTAYFAAVGYAGLAVATVATLGAGPVLIAIGARVTMGERLGRGGAATTGLALAGLALLVGSGAGAGSAPALGLLCALLSATGYAAVTVLNRRLGRLGGAPSATLGAFTVGLLCLLPPALAEGMPPTAGNATEVLPLLAYLGAVPTALAYGLFFAGLAAVRATTAAVVALVEPLAATVLALLWLDERLTAPATAGSILLAGAVLTLTLAERRVPATLPPTAPSASALTRRRSG